MQLLLNNAEDIILSIIISALHKCCEQGICNFVELLLSDRADIDLFMKNKALHTAFQHGDVGTKTNLPKQLAAINLCEK